jgi:hypothetical protein
MSSTKIPMMYECKECYEAEQYSVANELWQYRLCRKCAKKSKLICYWDDCYNLATWKRRYVETNDVTRLCDAHRVEQDKVDGVVSDDEAAPAGPTIEPID